MTVKEIAEYMGVHPMTIYKYVQDGEIPAFKIGASWRIRRDSIKKWMDENEHKNQGGV
ncbi:MAG: DNA-binding protein [Candidatus Omnitrophica bacterium CG_4_9_14_0_2_um_filter_42_8]|nr:MAG: DNA-binding protein [Candidatus Omnitrophica bacterium CG22_combo_CG10-13_8_21_14_all_43_16]PJC48737.1 MAG: DNA-binding protein [Candidatus Omnitrophica bacterium CG_4_9_14_0_2_um_filter_42_8]